MLADHDLAFQQSLQSLEPRAFLAVVRDGSVQLLRAKQSHLQSDPHTVSDVDDAFEPAQDVGHTGRGKHGMWRLVVDVDMWNPLGISDRLRASFAPAQAAVPASLDPPQDPMPKVGAVVVPEASDDSLLDGNCAMLYCSVLYCTVLFQHDEMREAGRLASQSVRCCFLVY